MSAQVSAVEPTALFEARASGGSVRGPVLAETLSALRLRVRAEYVEMPGLRLTLLLAARLFGVAPEVAHAVLDERSISQVAHCSIAGPSHDARIRSTVCGRAK
jgi:hypothetical protein